MTTGMTWLTGKTERIKPIAALLAIARLLRNPQDTRQVFLLTQALRGRSVRRAYSNFANSAAGARILASKRALIDTLADRVALAGLPEGSFGRAYLRFMAEEKLKAEALAELAEQNLNLPAATSDAARLYAGRMRDVHDLYHVLTGYGRDELGEVCVLAFSYPQQRIRSFWVISRLGAVHVWRGLRRAGLGGQGVLAALREAARNGARAAFLPGEDIEGLLPRNLDDVRTRLKIAEPAAYLDVMARVRRETGIFAGRLSVAPSSPGTEPFASGDRAGVQIRER